ncbi:MAG: membrane integrity-associated transporter subunit PqiC [Hyphomicrobiaceae bacterium]|nr:membrane integrity-associated transporter subunit PqiC [Hyphomicrobiaceae bacterium]
MEVRARYTLMGLFVLAVCAAGFWFVHWLETGGGLADRVTYRVRFEGPIAGLLKGSAVLFNGVRVGEVTATRLEAANPNGVMVDVAVDQTAPVRTDTKAEIDFQGLAGAPVVSLLGGSPGAPLLAKAEPAARVLTAEKDSGQSLTQAGRDALRRINAVVGENAGPLRNAIASIEKFVAALARNADKVDPILAGLERLTGGGAKPVVRMFDLRAATTIPALKAIPPGQLLVPEPRALANFESEKILVRGADLTSLENARWPDVLPRLLQARIVQSFENAKFPRALGRAPDGAPADFQLLTEIRRFEIAEDAAPRAVVELATKVLDKDGKIIGTRVFKAERPLASREPQAAVAALNDAFAQVATELVTWTCASM